MEENGNIPPRDTIVSDNSDSQLPAPSAGAGAGSTSRSQEKGTNYNASSHKSPKKRRKVNHGTYVPRPRPLGVPLREGVYIAP